MFKTILCLLLIACVTGAVLIATMLVLMEMRERNFVTQEFFRQTAAQIISSVFSGMLIAVVSFGSAYGLYKLQENDKIADARMDSFLKIENEVSENRLTLEVDMKTEKLLVPLPLKTTAWEQGKYQSPITTPQLLDGLKLLYDEIERYNWHVNFMRFLVTERSLTVDKLPEQAWESTKIVNDKLVAKLREFEKLTSREAVLLRQMSRREYEHRFGPWQDQVTPLSSFQQVKKQPESSVSAEAAGDMKK